MPDLRGRTAVVTGASQGVGRGIALALAEAGARVIATGRNEGRLQALAAEAAGRGGHVEPAVCDHSDEEQVKRLAGRVAAGLSILVNNAWGGYEANPNGLSMKPFWELETGDWEGMFERGLRLQFLSCRYLTPAMLSRPGGLIVNTIAWAEGTYLRNVYYDVVKQAAVRMVYGMSLELKKPGIAAVALAPGFVRTERVMAAHAMHPFDLSATESPEYIGRAVAHLAADPLILQRSGGVYTAGALAREYGFTDVDGRQPAPFVMPGEYRLD